MIWFILWVVGVFITNAYMDMTYSAGYDWKELLIKQACLILWFLYLPCSIFGNWYWANQTKRQNAARQKLREEAALAEKMRLCADWTEEQYQAALKELGPIFLAEPGTPEAKRAATLVDQIEAYEEIHYKIPEPTPAALAEYRLRRND